MIQIIVIHSQKKGVEILRLLAALKLHIFLRIFFSITLEIDQKKYLNAIFQSL